MISQQLQQQQQQQQHQQQQPFNQNFQAESVEPDDVPAQHGNIQYNRGFFLPKQMLVQVRSQRQWYKAKTISTRLLRTGIMERKMKPESFAVIIFEDFLPLSASNH